MWLNKLNDMSVGPLWVLRTPHNKSEQRPTPAADSCKACGLPWLEAGLGNTLVVLAEVLHDPLQQTLLQNCLRAVGLQDCAVFTMHQSCSISPEEARLALQNQLTILQPQLAIVFGNAAAQALDGSLQRGQAHQYQNVRFIVTHHPEEMIADPALKAQVWADLCLAHAH